MKTFIGILAVSLTFTASTPSFGATIADEDNVGLGFQGIGGRLAYVNVDAIYLDSGFSIGGVADFGTIFPNVHLQGYLSYWSASKTYDNFYGYDAGTYHLRDIVLGARAKYVFPLANPRIRPFVGAGFGLNLYKSTNEFGVAGAPDNISESATRLGLDFGGGLAYRVAPRLDAVGELWLSRATFNQATLYAGVSYALGH